MNVERHFQDVVTITHHCAVVVATTVNAATAVRVSHSPCLGAAVGMIWLLFVCWLTDCLFACAFACVFGMDSV